MQLDQALGGAASPTGFDGGQYAFIQSMGSISSSFVIGADSSLVLSWLNGGRPFFGPYNGDQTYQVLIDNTLLGTFSTISGQNFSLNKISGINLGAGVHTLTFAGQIPVDETAFIDQVSLTANVPEPTTLALSALGIFGFAVARRRK